MRHQWFICDDSLQHCHYHGFRNEVSHVSGYVSLELVLTDGKLAYSIGPGP